MGLMGLMGCGFNCEESDVLELDGGEGFREHPFRAELLEIALGEEGHATVDFDAEHLAAEPVGEVLCASVVSSRAEDHDIVADVVEKVFKHRLNWV